MKSQSSGWKTDDTSRALIAAFERARDTHETHDVSQLFSMALMGVFFVALMAGLASGAALYRRATQAQQAAYDLHLQSGLLTNVIRGGDLAGAVGEGEGPEGRALVLRRRLTSNTYETRIYLYEGNVVQELSVAGRPFDPKGATTLLASRTFDFSLAGSLLTITTDAGSFDVALRSSAVAGEDADAPQAEGVGTSAPLMTIVDEGGM